MPDPTLREAVRESVRAAIHAQRGDDHQHDASCSQLAAVALDAARSEARGPDRHREALIREVAWCGADHDKDIDRGLR